MAAQPEKDATKKGSSSDLSKMFEILDKLESNHIKLKNIIKKNGVKP